MAQKSQAVIPQEPRQDLLGRSNLNVTEHAVQDKAQLTADLSFQNLALDKNFLHDSHAME